MAKISIDDVKLRLQKDKSLYSVSKQVKAKDSDNIEFVKAINDNLFIFKLNGKYVLSPADDTLAPIIGEFDELPSDGDMPPCFSDWCEEYSNEINYFQDNENNNQKYGIASNTVLKSVDLGLSVKWTTCNIGATKPEEQKLKLHIKPLLISIMMHLRVNIKILVKIYAELNMMLLIN